jgi:DUF1707 SHOCT-like domain
VTPPHPRTLRASDADRERVVAVLAEAASDGRLSADEHAERVHRAYLARTLGDLAGLTRDLAAPSAQPLRLDDTRAVTAFFGTQRREGRWVVPARFAVTAVGGRTVLDLREALLQSRHTVVNAVLVGAQLHLLVPQGVSVTVSRSRSPVTGTGAAITGRAGAERAPVALAGPPVIEVRAFTMAGRVRVHTPRRPGRRWRGRRSR